MSEHRHRTKRIPSGFFNQPGAEFISAVIFGNIGTVTKFNRIGYLRGYGRKGKLRMVRRGTCHDHDPDRTEPRVFS